MKKLITLLGLLLVMALLTTIWWNPFHQSVTSQSDGAKENESSAETSAIPLAQPKVDSGHQQQKKPLAAAASTGNTEIPESVRAYVQNKRADPEYDWKQPINFYGRALDENDAPVSGALVDFKWNDLSPDGASSAQTTSDADGYFRLLNKNGKRLYVQVHKTGYYTSRSSGIAFEYANPADGLFKPDVNNPIVFQLRRRGLGADLVTSQVGVNDHLGVTADLDGTPVRVDLLERNVGKVGPLTLTQNKPNYRTWREALRWTFRMEIADGGFIAQKDEFPFEAPESGYEPVVQFDFQQGQTNWATQLSKDFYIKFGSPARYGRLHLETSIMMPGARLTYAINPSGSRYLEPK